MTFTIELLPARHGDALWIEYGQQPPLHRVLIDGGPSRATASTIAELISTRIGEVPAGQHDFELIVVTHIDADHIGGSLALLEDRTLVLRPRDVWFNGWDHLPTDVLGAKQGERLSRALVRRKLPWNSDFGGKAVSAPDEGPLPRVDLQGGMRLTLLSPTQRELAALRPVWAAEVRKAGLVPGYAAEQERARQPDLLGEQKIDPQALAGERFTTDDSEANGASIALLAEFDDKSVLLTGDAHAGVLERALRRLGQERGIEVIRVDAIKLPHHGSKYNLSSDILRLLDCDRYLFSTDGSSAAHHPDRVAVSRIITGRRGVTLEFNYRTAITMPWESRRLQRKFDYKIEYPAAHEPWLTVRL